MIRLYSQMEGGIERTTQWDTLSESQRRDVFWIDLLTPEPGEVKCVEELCGIELPTYDEMREIESTSRLYVEDGARFMTTTVLSRVDTDSPVLAEISFILLPDKVITIRHSDSYSFRVFSHQLLRKQQVARDQVFMGLLETIIDRQADVLERFGAEIDRLSKQIFKRDEGEEDGKRKRRSATQDMKAHLKDLGMVGDLISRQRDCLVNLLRMLGYSGNDEGATDELLVSYAKIRPLVRDVNSLSEYATFLSGKISFMLDAVLGLINIQQNDIIKIFTVASVIFLPPTLIASIYGMNFEHMPELRWLNGYYVALGMMVLSIIIPILYFKSKRMF